MEYFHPGPLDALLSKSDLSQADTKPEGRKSYPAVCACGEESGAAYYAWRHNRTDENDTPIIVEFEVDQSEMAVDGRDFLYTTFQIGDSEKARPILDLIFGKSILKCADAAWSSTDYNRRIAICDLAIYDSDVIFAHYANRMIIGGRHNTKFRNAFIVKLPIKPQAIIRAWSPTETPELPLAEILLEDVIHRR